MDITQQVISLAILIVFSLSEGVTHGVLYSERGAAAFPWNEHIIFNIGRLSLAAAAFVGASIWTLVAWGFMFSFFHNGSYYLTRNKINKEVYPDKWWGQSTSSSAKVELNPWLRTTLAVVGLAIFFLQYFL